MSASKKTQKPNGNQLIHPRLLLARFQARLHITCQNMQEKHPSQWLSDPPVWTHCFLLSTWTGAPSPCFLHWIIWRWNRFFRNRRSCGPLTKTGEGERGRTSPEKPATNLGGEFLQSSSVAAARWISLRLLAAKNSENANWWKVEVFPKFLACNYIMSYHIMSYHIISYHVISLYIYIRMYPSLF